MNLVDGRLRRKEKASTKPVVHSSIGSFGRGVQLPPISTTEPGGKLVPAWFCFALMRAKTELYKRVTRTARPGGGDKRLPDAIAEDEGANGQAAQYDVACFQVSDH